MKVCPGCRLKKPLSGFNKAAKRYDGVQPICRECQKQSYRNKYYNNEDERNRLRKNSAAKRQRVKDLIDKAKDVPCADCNQKFPPYVMDFDHLPGSEKHMEVSTMLSKRLKEEKVIAEIAKCEVVCSNCHRIRTHTRRINLAY